MKSQEVKQICKRAFGELVEAVERGESRKLEDYLKVIGRFHQYSFGNQMLIMMQRKEAEHVAGFWTWKKLGRSVKRGAKGIAIMAPIVYRKNAIDAKPDLDEESGELDVVNFFKTVYVFDVKDTQGRSLPQFAQVEGDPGVYLNRLKEYVASQGITLKSKHLYGSTQGYSAGGLIVVQENLPAAEQFSVMCHEMAHEVLHHNQQAREIDRSVKEIESEAISYVVCNGIGLELDTAHSDYMQLYQGDKEKLMKSLKRIQMTASEILKAITTERFNVKAA